MSGRVVAMTSARRHRIFARIARTAIRTAVHTSVRVVIGGSVFVFWMPVLGIIYIQIILNAIERHKKEGARKQYAEGSRGRR